MAEEGPLHQGEGREITLWLAPAGEGRQHTAALVWSAAVAVELRRRHRLVGAYLGHPGAVTTASFSPPSPGSGYGDPGGRSTADPARGAGEGQPARSVPRAPSDSGSSADDDIDAQDEDAQGLGLEGSSRAPALPLALMPEEVVLLLERGVVRLVVSEVVSAPATARQEHEALREGEVLRYRAQREAAAQVHRHNHLLAKGLLPPGSEPLPVPRDPLPPISMPTALAHFPWGAQGGVWVRSLAHARALGLWSYPATPAEEQRVQVFRALHAQGYHLTSGLKFGGDWLAYPGDPGLYHSALVVSVVGLHDRIPMSSVVAHGRLGNTVKKHHALCAWDASRQCLVTSCIQWTGWTARLT
jgi:hypothetical protein